MKRFLLFFRVSFTIAVITLLVSTSVWQSGSEVDRIHQFTRPLEFDYVTWTLNAIFDKLSMASLGFNHYLTLSQDRKIMQDYFKLLQEKNQLETAVEAIYSDPEIDNPEEESIAMRQELFQKKIFLENQSSLAEVIIQKQVSTILNQLDLANLGQPFPPVLYHTTDLPKQIIISPRDVIEQSAAISLQADINLAEIINLEDEIEENSAYSALAVDIGGVGTYPTMVINTSSLSFLLETVAHEWIHNYLVFQPLGIRYSASPEMRTMNETTASIAGKEICDAVLRSYYRDLIPDPNEELPLFRVSFQDSQYFTDAIFDFNLEMYRTRTRVDDLLSQGKIEEAEEYMEERRQAFWDNGFQIRKLNQAYFAFHGAYADDPFSAAGEDPVGAAVRTLRARSKSLPEFIEKIRGLKSYTELYLLINTY